jgi:ribonuclease HI
MAQKKKYYVVWSGRTCGVFEDWNTCKSLIESFEGAKYKSFETQHEAELAYKMGHAEYYKHHPVKKQPALSIFGKSNKPIPNSLSVDAAWNSVTKVMEYRGVHTGTYKPWFHRGPFEGASNNIGEFLALVHGLAFLKEYNFNIPIYSDSITAIAWVRNKKTKSVILPTDKNIEVFNLVERAEQWLLRNSYTTPVFKWNTVDWGEIPADFGRK